MKRHITMIVSLLRETTRVASIQSLLPFMSSNEKLKCRTVRAILHYHEPNPDKYPEKYAHHLLFTFYPFHNEDNLELDGFFSITTVGCS